MRGSVALRSATVFLGLFLALPADAAEAPVPIPQPSAKALRYYRSGNALWVLNEVWGLAVPAVILAIGASARLRNVARRLGGQWLFISAACFAVLYLALMFLIDAPLDFYEGYLRPHAYGLSNQSPARWLDHHVKAWFVSAVVSALVAGLVYMIIAQPETVVAVRGPLDGAVLAVRRVRAADPGRAAVQPFRTAPRQGARNAHPDPGPARAWMVRGSSR